MASKKEPKKEAPAPHSLAEANAHMEPDYEAPQEGEPAALSEESRRKALALIDELRATLG